MQHNDSSVGRDEALDSAKSKIVFVLLRGLARSSDHWLDFPAKLSAKFSDKLPDSKIICLDIPGNGSRSNEKTPIDVELIIRDLRGRVIAQNQKIILIGISLGGMVALKWNELFPEEISQTIVINTSLAQCSWFFQRLSPLALLPMLRAMFANSVVERERNVLLLTSNRSDRVEVFLERLCRIAEMHSTKIENFFRQLGLASRIRLKKDFSPNGLVVVASKKDQMVSAKCSQDIVKSLRGVLVLHEWAGHDLTLDDPDWVIEVLERHLIC